MEVAITPEGTFELLYDKMDMIIHIAAFAFSVAIFVMIISSAFKLGWRLWPWVFGLGLLAFLLV
ncbi:MAG: hypothetical protein ISQ22_08180 [Rhizobiales bacterium]|nr:hypothetical protein [Hyphomicrobiales bacterium]